MDGRIPTGDSSTSRSLRRRDPTSSADIRDGRPSTSSPGPPRICSRGGRGTRWKKRGREYDALKERLAARLLDALYEHVPQTRGKVETRELSTPLTTRHFSNHPSGEIYGLAHTPRRFEQRWRRPRTGLRRLYLTGQDVATAGVAGALIGGALCASAILRKNLIGSIVRRSGAEPGLGRVTAGPRTAVVAGDP